MNYKHISIGLVPMPAQPQLVSRYRPATHVGRPESGTTIRLNLFSQEQFWMQPTDGDYTYAQANIQLDQQLQLCQKKSSQTLNILLENLEAALKSIRNRQYIDVSIDLDLACVGWLYLDAQLGMANQRVFVLKEKLESSSPDLTIKNLLAVLNTGFLRPINEMKDERDSTRAWTTGVLLTVYIKNKIKNQLENRVVSQREVMTQSIQEALAVVFAPDRSAQTIRAFLNDYCPRYQELVAAETSANEAQGFRVASQADPVHVKLADCSDSELVEYFLPELSISQYERYHLDQAKKGVTYLLNEHDERLKRQHSEATADQKSKYEVLFRRIESLQNETDTDALIESAQILISDIQNLTGSDKPLFARQNAEVPPAQEDVPPPPPGPYKLRKFTSDSSSIGGTTPQKPALPDATRSKSDTDVLDKKVPPPVKPKPKVEHTEPLEDPVVIRQQVLNKSRRHSWTEDPADSSVRTGSVFGVPEIINRLDQRVAASTAPSEMSPRRQGDLRRINSVRKDSVESIARSLDGTLSRTPVQGGELDALFPPRLEQASSSPPELSDTPNAFSNSRRLTVPLPLPVIPAGETPATTPQRPARQQPSLEEGPAIEMTAPDMTPVGDASGSYVDLDNASFVDTKVNAEAVKAGLGQIAKLFAELKEAFKQCVAPHADVEADANLTSVITKIETFCRTNPKLIAQLLDDESDIRLTQKQRAQLEFNGKVWMVTYSLKDKSDKLIFVEKLALIIGAIPGHKADQHYAMAQVAQKYAKRVGIDFESEIVTAWQQILTDESEQFALHILIPRIQELANWYKNYCMLGSGNSAEFLAQLSSDEQDQHTMLLTRLYMLRWYLKTLNSVQILDRVVSDCGIEGSWFQDSFTKLLDKQIKTEEKTLSKMQKSETRA